MASADLSTKISVMIEKSDGTLCDITDKVKFIDFGGQVVNVDDYRERLELDASRARWRAFWRRLLRWWK